MLGHVTTITHKNNLVLSNIDPGAGGTSTRKVKIGNLPNIFDDDCSYSITELVSVDTIVNIVVIWILLFPYEYDKLFD